MLKVSLRGQDFDGRVSEAIVTKEGAIIVVPHNHPFLGEAAPMQPFRSYFKNAAGSSNMNIDGSAQEERFFITADAEFDIFIKYIAVEIGDIGQINLNKFGNEGALTNGVAWCWFNNEEGEYVLHEGIKTNKAFIRIAGDTGAIGTGSDAYLADVSGGSEKSYLPNIDLSETFGMPFGIRLRAGSNDRLEFVVRDALQGLTRKSVV